MSSRSHVEVAGWTARHYDLMMDVLMLGRYQAFIEKAIGLMSIEPGDAILDLGSGTARNICVMVKHLGDNGRIVGMDIGAEMLRQARERCQAYPQVSFLEQRIEEPLPFHEEYDKAFTSFVLHGFEDQDKDRIMTNVHQALKPGGEFWILDYDEFDLGQTWALFRWIFQHFECPLATEFLSLDL